MNTNPEAEKTFREKFRRFMCSEPSGKGYLELFEAIKIATSRDTSLIKEDLCKIMDKELETPPSGNDPSMLGIQFAVNLMKFQHRNSRTIEKVDVTHRDTSDGVRVWDVNVSASNAKS